MPRYTRAHFVCSCGKEYGRDSFGVHKKLYPEHHEVRRYTFGATCGVEQVALAGGSHRCILEGGHKGAHNCACGEWWGYQDTVYIGVGRHDSHR